MRLAHHLLLALTLTLVLFFQGVVALADSGIDPHVRPALRNCVQFALQEKYEAWTCTSAGVSVTHDAAGKRVDKFIAVRPGRITHPRGVTIQDDYDYWCENGSVCHRTLSSYVEETKGNAAYGDNNGVIGAYDAIVRTNLNGRQAQWKVTLIRDYGPTLKFQGPPQVVCWDHWGAIYISCGSHSFTGPSALSGRWSSPWLYGNRLSNADWYHGAFTAQFKPAGYTRIWSAKTLDTDEFKCGTTGNCAFPP